MSRTPDYQPYVAGPFRWRLALRPLELDHWIEIGENYERDMAVKARVRADHPDTVFAALPDVEPEAAEVLDTLVDHLTTRFPDDFRRSGDGLRNLRLGEDVAVEPTAAGTWAEHPLSVCGGLVQEDLALLVPRRGELVFGGGSVCFPNRWDLSSKIGLSLAQVHEPVARLNAQLREPIDSFFERLTPDKPFWRLGWGVLDTDDPYQPLDGTAVPAPTLPEVGDPATGDRLFLRVERETIRRFPVTGAVLFTIRTYIRPLRHLVERPEDAARLAEALDNLPDDVRDYKRTSELTAPALAWLGSVATPT
ncbi:MAG: heme-dependent oxidative N-demethylase family protein [Actinomycetota bacterium]